MPRIDNNHAISCTDNVENHVICCAENVENHAIFVEGFLPDFYARGRFMKYSMSVLGREDEEGVIQQKLISYIFIFFNTVSMIWLSDAGNCTKWS